MRSKEYPTDEEVAKFAQGKDYPGILMKLGPIKSSNPETPLLWRYFLEKTGASDPLWNFRGKFLVSKTGEVTVPTDLEKDIERLIEE
mmetsp:Transcript_32829/g.79817  ORF Transcript_32829/g.79817 Transcript_32829/m.79817 type:complete len:87 (+) Transcript_32829:507-767(+)